MWPDRNNRKNKDRGKNHSIRGRTFFLRRSRWFLNGKKRPGTGRGANLGCSPPPCPRIPPAKTNATIPRAVPPLTAIISRNATKSSATNGASARPPDRTSASKPLSSTGWSTTGPHGAAAAAAAARIPESPRRRTTAAPARTIAGQIPLPSAARLNGTGSGLDLKKEDGRSAAHTERPSHGSGNYVVTRSLVTAVPPPGRTSGERTD